MIIENKTYGNVTLPVLTSPQLEKRDKEVSLVQFKKKET